MKYFVLLVILFSASKIHDLPSYNALVVWSVGQGQWVTAIAGDRCLHFDAGGEYFPWSSLSQVCGRRDNYFYLTHWDWDHVGALTKTQLIKSLGSACLAVLPRQKPKSEKKASIISRFQQCPDSSGLVNFWRPSKSKESNAQSNVFSFKKILIPGDSPQSQEKIWLLNSWVKSSRVLILGHHGSKTSTSLALLSALTSLKMTISSARWARYGHPHSQTIVNLRAAKKPLLKTEDWGNIWIEL